MQIRYYAKYNDAGELVSFGTTCCEITDEITEEEYLALMTNAAATREYVNQVYNGEMEADAVPEEYREKVKTQVEKLIADREMAAEEQDITNAEALAIITGEEYAVEEDTDSGLRGEDA